MGDVLSKRLVQSHFDGPVHEAMLNLMVASAQVREAVERVCQAHGLSTAQYNVLRILRGGPPDGYPRCEIARRMIDRAPDVTRIIDRLQSSGWVERVPSARDRRLSMTRITARGRDLLERMRADVGAASRAWADGLTPEEVAELSRLCEKIYGDPPA